MKDIKSTIIGFLMGVCLLLFMGQTTSFNKPLNRNEKIPDRFLNLLEECMSYYKQMEKYKINNE